MAEILSSLVKPAMEELGRFTVVKIKHLFTYLCFFNNNIQGLRDEAQKLEDARIGLQREVVAAENNAEVILPEVRTWLENASKKIQVDKSGIDNEIPTLKNGCWGVKPRFLLSRKAVKLTGEMKQLIEERNKFNHISTPPLPAAQAEISLGTTYEFQSRKQIEEEIMEALRAKEVTTMGICGMGGVGKTTMAKRIMDRMKKENIFQEIFMVVVSQQADISKIQDEIAESLGLSLSEKTLSARANKIHERLMSAKRILIVLDDVWEKLKLEDLGVPCGNERCTILLTSRNKEVLKKMDAQKVYGVEILSDTEAWFLFREKTGTCVDDPNLFSTAEKVVRECKGLPIALITVGGACGEFEDQTNITLWEDALQQLKSFNPEDMPDVIKDVYNPLKLSYTKLESRHAKSLFLLCSLFPEDVDISLEELTSYCVGLRMFSNLDFSNASEGTVEKVRKRVFTIVNMLKNRFLLLNGRNEHHVKMHDVVRDVAIYIASHEAKEGIVDVKFNSMRLSAEYTYHWVEVLGMHGLIWYRNFEIEDFPIFEGIKQLSLLSFHSIIMKSIPLEIQLLKNLRTLRLEFCELESFSVVGELLSLEILCCHNCNWIEELPVEIGNLTQLKLLDFTNCRRLRTIPPGVVSKLVELEEFKMIESFSGWELATVAAEVQEQGRRNASLNEFENCDGIEELPVEIANLNQLNQLDFTNRRNLRRNPPGVVSKLVELEDFKMIESFGGWELASVAAKVQGHGRRNACLNEFEKLPKLNRLEIEINDFNLAAEEIRFSANIARYHIRIGDIHYVHDHEISHAKGMCVQLSKEINLGSWVLRFLRSTDRLYLDGDGLKSLDLPQAHNMKSLKIVDCCTDKELVSSTTTSMDESSKFDVFPILERLELSRLCKLEEIYDGPVLDQSNSFRNLENLELVDLPALKHLCKRSNRNIVSLDKLRHIKIRNCNNLQNLFSFTACTGTDEISSGHDTDDLLCTEKVYFPMLETMKLEELDKLEIIWNSPIPHGSHSFKNLKELILFHLSAMTYLWKSPNLSVSLSSLSRIRIYKCNKLRSFFLSTMSMEFLSQLEELGILDCEMMEQVLLKEENENDGNQCRHTIKFSKLSKLELDSLKSLTAFGKGIRSIEFTMLEDIRIRNCPKLMSILFSDVNNQNSTNDHDEFASHLFCSQKISFGSLKRISIDSIQVKRNIWCHQISVGFFSKLEVLEIFRCSSIRSLFSSSIAVNLVNLEILKIWSCNEITKVIEDNEEMSCEKPLILFPSLKLLSLVFLPKLESFCSWRCDLRLPSLGDVEILTCRSLEFFTTKSVMTPKLGRIRVDRDDKDVGDLNGAIKLHFEANQRQLISTN